MVRATLWLALILGAILVVGCGGEGDESDAGLTPQLLTFEILPNPVDLNDEATFVMSWTDVGGDLNDLTVNLRLEKSTDLYLRVPVDDPVITGDAHAGTITFTLQARDGYEGNYIATLTDAEGNTSEELAQYLYINVVRGAED